MLAISVDCGAKNKKAMGHFENEVPKKLHVSNLYKMQCMLGQVSMSLGQLVPNCWYSKVQSSSIENIVWVCPWSS